MFDILLYLLMELGCEEMFAIVVKLLGGEFFPSEDYSRRGDSPEIRLYKCDRRPARLVDSKFQEDEKEYLHRMIKYLTEDMKLSESEAIGFVAYLAIPFEIKVRPERMQTDPEKLLEQLVEEMDPYIEVC